MCGLVYQGDDLTLASLDGRKETWQIIELFTFDSCLLLVCLCIRPTASISNYFIQITNFNQLKPSFTKENLNTYGFGRIKTFLFFAQAKL